MSKASRPYKEGLLEDLRDPSEAVAYLTAALEDGSPDVFRMEFFVNEEEHDHDHDAGLLVLGTMGTLGGAVGYPIYKAIKKEKVSYRKKYLLTGADGFQLLIE